MGDADDSYDFTALLPFVEQLRDGADLVMGNRFKGGIAPGAMPPLHRYLGNPVLSFIGRLFFPSAIGDFHCGLRGFRRDSILKLGLQTGGMEFASEMVVRSTLSGLDVREVPTTLSPDGRSRPPHLRSWRDGWRHLRFLMLYSPRWLFFIPGLVLMTLGLVAGAALTFGPVYIGKLAFDVDTLVGASAMVVIGFQASLFALFTKVYAAEEGFLPEDRRVRKLVDIVSLERGLIVGGLLALGGLGGLVASLVHWQTRSFGPLIPSESLRIVVLGHRADRELPDDLRGAVHQHSRHPPYQGDAHRRGRLRRRGGRRGRQPRRRGRAGGHPRRRCRAGVVAAALSVTAARGGTPGNGRPRRRVTAPRPGVASLRLAPCPSTS